MYGYYDSLTLIDPATLPPFTLTASPAGTTPACAPVTLTAPSAQPYYRPGTAATALGTAGTCTITIPATVQAGDLMLVSGVFKVATGTDSIQTPSGWTQLVAPTNATGTQFNAAIYARVATAASAGTTVTIAGGIPSAQQINAVFAAYANVSTVVRSAALANNGVTASTTITAATASTSTDDLVVYVASARENANGPAGAPSFTGPGTIRAQSTATSAAAQNVGIAIGDDGGTAGARTVTASVASWSVAGQIVLKSAANQPQLATTPAATLNGGTPTAALGTLRHNIAPNPAAGQNATGWSGSNTIARVTGLTAMPVTTGINATATGFVQTPTAPVVAGQVATVSFYIQNNTANSIAGRTVYVSYTRSSGGDVFPETFTVTPGAPGSTVRGSFTTAAAPSLATGLYLVIDSLDGTTGTGVVVTAVDYEISPTLGSYFDGNTVGPSIWDGVADNSSSSLAVTPGGTVLTAAPAGTTAAGAPDTFNVAAVLTGTPAGTTPAGAGATFGASVILAAAPAGTVPGGVRGTLNTSVVLATAPGGTTPAGAADALNLATALAGQPASTSPTGAPGVFTVGVPGSYVLTVAPGGCGPAGATVSLNLATALTVTPAGTNPRGSGVAYATGTVLTATAAGTTPAGTRTVLNLGLILTVWPAGTHPRGNRVALTAATPGGSTTSPNPVQVTVTRPFFQVSETRPNLIVSGG